MDPVLKGTSYGAALEAAARDEQAKREKRLADQDLRHIARSQADTLRQAQRDAHEALRVGAVAPAPVSDQEILSRLTRAQVGILETGAREAAFPLSRWQVSQPAVDLMAWKLIARHGPGAYTLTDAGRRVYALWVAAHGPLSQPEPPVSVDSDAVSESESPPTLTVPPAPEEAPAMTATALPYSEAQLTILALGLDSDTARVPKGTAIKRLFNEGLTVRTTNGHYKTTDKGRAALTVGFSFDNASPDDSAPDDGDDQPDINLEDPALQADDPTTASVSSDHMAVLAMQRQTRITQLEKTIDDLSRQLQAVPPAIDLDEQLTAYGLSRADILRIRDMQAQDGQQHLTVHAYIVSLWESVVSLGDALAAAKPDPAVVAIGTSLLKAWKETDTYLTAADWLRDLIKSTDRLDEAATQIEALRRCIEDLEARVRVRDQELREVKRHDLAAAILDDLCETIPAVETYRAAREQANQALDALRRR